MAERGPAAPTVLPLHGASPTAGEALAALGGHLARCALAPATVRSYRRQAAGYATWLAAHASDHPDAFTDAVGAEGAVTGYRRHLLRGRASPATVNQALAAITLLYAAGAGLRIHVKRAGVPRPGQPEVLTPAQQDRLEREATRRGPREAAIIAVLLYTGARAGECAALDTGDVAITPRTGRLRLHGKGDQVRTVPLPSAARTRLQDWLEVRGPQAGPLWTGQRGPLTGSGITQAVLATGAAADLHGLRPHRLRHTYATRLRRGGADVAQIQALLGHADLTTSARYFRAGNAEQAAVVESVFER